jgi:xylan 1,4-beta-xylosidase
LSGLTRDLPETDTTVRSSADGAVEVTLPMNSNDIVLVKLWRNKAAR